MNLRRGSGNFKVHFSHLFSFIKYLSIESNVPSSLLYPPNKTISKSFILQHAA